VTSSGSIEVIPDKNPARQPVYDPNVPVSVIFPSLYPHGETAPTDCGEHTLARWLLKKQCQFAQKTEDDRLLWTHNEDGVHMMYEYARIVEMNVRGLVGWFLSVHPEKSHIPIQNLLDAFREGMHDDKGSIDSQLPELQGIMTRIRNSREKWFSERLGIETVSRDLGDANCFITLNMEPRAWPDVRRLLFELQEGQGTPMPDDYFEVNTEKFTELLDKYATQVAVYLSKKAQLFAKTFFDICRIPEEETGTSFTKPTDRTETSFYWGRVEFTQYRGCSHWHYLAKLPGVLDTAILSRLIQDMRIVRTELKHGNIKDYDKAWQIIKMGLLATRYLVLFANSVSTSAFFTELMDDDHYDESKVIDLDAIRKEFVKNYVNKNITKSTHPIMRVFDDPECDENVLKEMASVAAVCCVHECIESICGGDKNDKNCRFSLPLKLLKYTVPAIMDVLENQMELQILHRRTNGRIPNLQKYFLQYYRANHDFTALADSSHKMRYAAKYVSKSGQIETLLNDVIENVERKQSSVIPPNVKQVMTHLLLADCSHRAYMTKQQLAYFVMDLPQVIKSFTSVRTVAHYPRATIIEDAPYTESGVIELSDRTDYSAYAERCCTSTVTKGDLTTDQLSAMNLREFAESINFTWVRNKKDCNTDQDTEETTSNTVKWRCRDKRTGHWVMSKKRKAVHVRSSTLLYTDVAMKYTPDTSIDRFTELPREQQDQLKRVYQELVMYVPWKDDPDQSFLSSDAIDRLNDDMNDPDRNCRYSLKRLHEYWKVYMKMLNDGAVAPVGSQWHRDNQYSYTMYLANRHNKSIRQDRVANDGIFVAKYETADELEGTDIEIRGRLAAETDNDEYPSVMNFIPSDVLQQVEHQLPPTVDELRVAFPEHRLWKDLKKNSTRISSNLFMANPDKPDVRFSALTPMQKHAVDMIVSGKEKIVYVYGKAGCGKTVVAQHLCAKFKGQVQAAAGTGRAASNFNGPTIHGAFLWGAQGVFNNATMTPSKKQKLQNFYEKTELFIFDEINACGADILCMIDETMKELFCNVSKRTGKRIDQPFGGKSVVFLGDSAQLKPVCAAAIYDKTVCPVETKYRSDAAKNYFKCAQKGQKIYQEFLVPNCVYLQQGKRNCGLLQQIMDRLREGQQTEDDLDKLTHQRQLHPDYIAERGIHYSNESATFFNCCQLWDACTNQNRRFYMCRAMYYTTERNDRVIRALSSIPASDYGYAPDVLCLAEGCEVRLIRNIDTSAGLVTNSTGRVVEIIFDNRDVSSLLKGEHPPPYCIIVSFPAFIGFLSKSDNGRRCFPFENHKLVPVYRTRFTLDKIPTDVSKVQEKRLCYREQFPIDLSTNLTAHRGQGQTWKNCTLSVNLGFENPQNKIPSDATSITYVACTRITMLKDLFLSPIYPSIWQDMGKSDKDVARREHEEKLKEAAKDFASRNGMYQECVDEMNFTETYVDVDREWDSLKLHEVGTSLPATSMLTCDSELRKLKEGTHLDGMPGVLASLKPAETERFIGIDQGLKTFSMVAVDRKRDAVPRIIEAVQLNLVDLGILDNGGKFCATDVLLLIRQHSPLYSWMTNVDCDDGNTPRHSKADRVVVVMEQIAPDNAHVDQLGQNLGYALQRDFDVNVCVVKMSQPHVHRKNGPMFKLGDEIVEACDLKPASYDDTRKRIVQKRHSTSADRKRRSRKAVVHSDVEPSDSSEDSVINTDIRREQNAEYKRKKAMSSAIFKYFILATPAQQTAMQVEIDSDVQQFWKECKTVEKYDDLGDALLHALDEILCSGSNYRQLLPSSIVLQKNRTVVVVVLPDKVCWATIECVYNEFVLQDIGIGNMPLQHENYSESSVIDKICGNMPYRLAVALQSFESRCSFLTSTDFVNVIVKQLKQNVSRNLSSKVAGALTNAVVRTMTNICDKILPSGTVYVENNRKTGWRYSRKCESSGRKYVISRSSGKHLNAVLSCLQWMKSNLPDFVRDRPLKVGKDGKLAFFEALRKVALAAVDENSARLESIKLNKHAVHRLKFIEGEESSFVKTILGDLILIALNNNQQYIRALSDNYRSLSQQ
jgi:RecA/RadA recombinase